MSVNGPTAINEAEGAVMWANMADDDLDLHPPPMTILCKMPGCAKAALPGAGIYAKLCAEHKAEKQRARKAPAPVGTGNAAVRRTAPSAAASTPEPTTLDKLITELEQQAALYTRQLEIARRMREDLSPARERGA